MKIKKPSMLPMMGDENHPPSLAYCNGCVEYLNQQFYICVALITGVFLVFLMLNFFHFLKPIDESIGSWLERSGAIVGAVALMVEFRVKKLESAMTSASMRLAPTLYARVSKYETHLKWLHRIVLFYGISGTIIWSYGEPLYKFFMKIWL